MSYLIAQLAMSCSKGFDFVTNGLPLSYPRASTRTVFTDEHRVDVIRQMKKYTRTCIFRCKRRCIDYNDTVFLETIFDLIEADTQYALRNWI